MGPLGRTPISFTGLHPPGPSPSQPPLLVLSPWRACETGTQTLSMALWSVPAFRVGDIGDLVSVPATGILGRALSGHGQAVDVEARQATSSLSWVTSLRSGAPSSCHQPAVV